jgi:hypothetical protein
MLNKDIRYLKELISKMSKIGGNKKELDIWLTLFDYMDYEAQQDIIKNIEEHYKLLKNN